VYVEDLTTATFWPEIEVDGEGLSKPHRQYKLMEERRERDLSVRTADLFEAFLVRRVPYDRH